MKMKNKTYRPEMKANAGFSMIELMFAVGVLAIALIGGMTMVVFGVARNSSSRMDTTATNVAQTVLEDISGAPPNSNPVLGITDCRNNNLQITTAVGGATLAANNADIDFTQAVVPGYQANYTACGTNGLSVTYDVRWRVDPVAGTAWGKLVTVAARQPLAIRNGTIFYSPPVTLRTIVGM